jgi:hypothetical protein
MPVTTTRRPLLHSREAAMAAAYEIQQQQTQQLRSDAASTSWRFRDTASTTRRAGCFD